MLLSGEQFDDIDVLLEQWETIRNIQVPSLRETVNEAIVREYAKNTIDNFSHNIRISRLENNRDNEVYYMGKFAETFRKYEKDLTYRILKSDHTFSNSFKSFI